MPTTFISLLIFIFALLPGIPAHSIYSNFAGYDWREKDWERIASVLIFSVLGFVLYALISSAMNLPIPTYVYPSTFSTDALSNISLPNLSVAYLGHCVLSAVTAFLVGMTAQYVAKWYPSKVYPSSWDIFIRKHVPSHWVVVTLTDDRSYLGILSCVESSVAASERDVIIEEPAELNQKTRNFEFIPYKSLFLPSSLVSTIAVLHDPDLDDRLTEVGEELSAGGQDDSEKEI